MLLPEISIKRPVLATMMSLALVLAGVVSLTRLPVREIPDVDPPIVNVRTVYVGASAAVVETEVTEKLEEAINGIEGIKTLTSESREESSNVVVEFSLARDIDLAAQDVRDRVARVRGELPDDIEEPVVAKQDSDAQPIIWVALFSDRHSTLELSGIAENVLQDPLQTVNGVSSVILGGQKRYAIRLRLDSQRMAARGVTVGDIERALREQNVELPSGRVENVDRELTIETRGQLKTPEQFERLVVSRSGPTLVRLADVGYAEVGVEDERAIARYNAKPAVGLGVVKQSKANTIAVADGIKGELKRLAPILPPGVQSFVAYDESIYVEESIHEVWRTLGIAFVLVVAIIFIFLRSVRSTFVPAVTIPVSTLSTFAVLALMGYSVNIISMLALVLAIGIVVDDSIVVLENIYRHIEEGETPMAAAFSAMKEIAFAVIATTGALVAVFLPLTYQRSLTGRLFIEFAVALSGAVIISTFVALSLTPMIASRVLRPSGAVEHGRMFLFFERIFDAVTSRYLKWLGWCLGHRRTIVALALASFFFAWGFYQALQREFLPEEDKGRLLAFAITPEGSTSEYTDLMVQKMEQIVLETPEVLGFFSAVALPYAGPGKGNEGLMFMRFSKDRERNLRDIVNGPQGFGARFFSEIEGALVFPIMPKAVGGSFSQPFQLVLQHQDLEELNRAATELVGGLQRSGWLANVRSQFAYDKPQLEVSIDRDRAAALGVSIEDIARTLQILFGGRDLSTVKVGGEEYDVIVQLERQQRLKPADLEDLYVRGAAGQLIQLNNVVSYRPFAGPNAVYHYDRLRSATIEGTPVGLPLGDVMEQTEALIAEKLPEGFRYTWAGESDDLREASADTAIVVVLAVVVIYMVLAALFESLVHPLTVMLALPLAVLGAFGGLWVFSWINAVGEMLYGWAHYAPDAPAVAGVFSALVPRIPSMTVNIFSQIGIVLLFGLVTKNSILLVEFANQRLRAGLSAHEAMLEAGRLRLRPILMTALSTIFGILPIAIGFGAGAEGRRPMGVAVVCGMLVSTGLTLFIVPVVYTVFDDLAKRFRKHRVSEALLLLFLLPLIFPLTAQSEETPVASAPKALPKPTQAVLTLRRSVEIALRDNFEIRKAKERIEKQYGVVVEARSFLLPRVALEGLYDISDARRIETFGDGDFGTSENWTAEVVVRQPIYSGGRSFSNLAKQRFLRTAAEHEFRETVNNVVFDVRRQFYLVLLTRAQVDVREQSVGLLEEELKSAQNRFKAGTVSEFDVLRAEVELANSRTPLIRTRNAYRLAVEELYRMLGMTDISSQAKARPEVSGKLRFEPKTVSLDDSLSSSRQKRPELKRANALVEAAEKGVKIEWANFLPDISVFGAYGYQKEMFSDDLTDTLDGWRGGVRGEWKVFDSFEHKARVDQSRSELTIAELNLRQQQLDIEVEVRRAYSTFIESKALVRASMKVVRQAEESLRLARNRFEAGVSTQLDVLDAQVSLTEARTNEVLALYDYNVAWARMERAVGRGVGQIPPDSK